MTRIEQIKEYAKSFEEKGMESEALKEVIRLAIIDGAMWADKHPIKPSLPSNLDEAANDYGRDIRLGYPRVMDETDRYIYNAFKAGAEWMAGQGYTEEARVWVLGKDETPAVGVDDVIYLPKNLFERGDKVIIQVRKNEAILRYTKVKSLTSALDLERRNDESEDAIQNA